MRLAIGVRAAVRPGTAGARRHAADLRQRRAFVLCHRGQRPEWSGREMPQWGSHLWRLRLPELPRLGAVGLCVSRGDRRPGCRRPTDHSLRLPRLESSARFDSSHRKDWRAQTLSEASGVLGGPLWTDHRGHIFLAAHCAGGQRRRPCVAGGIQRPARANCKR